MARRSKAQVFAQNDNVILDAKSTSRTSRRTGVTSNRLALSFTWEDKATLAPYFDSVWLLDRISTDVLHHIAQEIREGKEGDGSKQVALNPKGEQGYEARKGTRPNVRGHTNRPNNFPDNITRTKIAASGRVTKIGYGRQGTRASCKIKAGPLHRAFVQREGEQGITYLTVPERVVKESLARWVKDAMGGAPLQEPSTSERKDKDGDK